MMGEISKQEIIQDMAGLLFTAPLYVYRETEQKVNKKNKICSDEIKGTSLNVQKRHV